MFQATPVLQVIGIQGQLKAIPASGYVQLTVSTVALLLSATVAPAGTVAVMISLDNATNSFRWRNDGVSPTAAIGMLVADLSPRIMSLADYNTTRVIRAAAADAVLNITYYGR